MKNLRGIASLYPESVQIVARADSGIKSLKDIRGKSLIPGDRGSASSVDTLNILSYYGMTFKDFSSVDWLPFSVGAQRLQDQQADVSVIVAGWPTAAVVELAMSTDVVIVPIDEDAIKMLTTKFPFYTKVIIPKNTYKGMKQDVATITVMAQWVVDEQVPEDVVYKLTKALWEKGKDGMSGADVLAKVHAKGKDVQLKTALSGMAIPLHPGAARYYKEKNLIK